MSGEVHELVETLRSGSEAARRDAAEKLARLEAEAQAAAVPLVEACASADETLRDWAVAALEGLGPPDAKDVGPLAALVEHSSLDVAYWAATLLGRLRGQAAAAVPALVEALGEGHEMPLRQRAAWALGHIGPAAAAARESLQRAAEDADCRLARLAQDALGRL
jgi:HEAT repeat protein